MFAENVLWLSISNLNKMLLKNIQNLMYACLKVMAKFFQVFPCVIIGGAASIKVKKVEKLESVLEN